MRFASPTLLWLLVLPPLYLLWIFWDQRQRSRRLSQLVQSGLWSKVFGGLIPGARSRRGASFAIALLFGVLALARPQWGTIEETVKISGLDILFVLDVSNSMAVEDVAPNRLKKAKHVLRNVVGSVVGDRVGLVLFAGSSYLACPLTTDTDYVIENLELADPELIQNQGTDIGSAIETAQRALEAGSQEGKPGSRVIILVTDGEDHEGKAASLAASLKEKGMVLYVVGVGTENGGPIPIREESGRAVGFKRDGRDAVVSRLEPKTLVDLAQAGGGVFWKATTEEKEVDEISEKLKSLARGDLQERKIVQYKDRYQWPLFIMILALFYELFIPMRLMKPFWAALLLVSLNAQAASSPDSYFENKKGLDAYTEKNPDKALEHFKKAGEKAPDQAEFLFNQGMAHLQKKDLDHAIQNFSESKEKALKGGRKDLAARSSFNEAVAQSQADKNDEAIKSYLSAADLARQSQDADLLRDAKKNLELLGQKMEQKKQEQKNQKDKDKKDKKDDKDQKDKKDSQQGQKPQDSEESKDEKDPQQSKNEDPKESKDESEGQKQKKSFRSLKLSPEDADRVMAELANREKQLQIKLRKQKVTPGRNLKDW